MEKQFKIGDKVRIIPLENHPGRVMGIYQGQQATEYEIRYFFNGEKHVITLLGDELSEEKKAK